MKLSINRRLPVVAIGVFTLLAGAAQATHWPQPGADPGRSGHQPADRAVLPLEYRGRAADSVRTSPIITAGGDLSAQQVAYGYFSSDASGTDPNARIRIARLSDLGSLFNPDIDDEAPRDSGTGTSDDDAFGPAGTEVAPVHAAANHNTAGGQIYVVHNDDNQPNFDATGGANGTESTSPNATGNDLALAQIDAATGARRRDFSIGSGTPGIGFNTNGYTIESSPVIGPDDGTGERDIYFVARSATEKRIFGLSVPSAANSTTNDFSLTVSANIPDLNTKARPTLVTLLEPDNAQPVTMIAVATSDGVRTYRASAPGFNDPGPSISGLGMTWSPSAPVLVNGNTPSQTPFFYVASATSGGGTVVSKLRQRLGAGGEEALKNLDVVDSSPELSGTPGPALALAQETPLGTGERPKPGRVVVGTSTNIYSLNTESLSSGNPPQVFSQDLQAGFSQTVPATSGELGFAVNNAGQQYVFYLTPRNGSMRVPLSGFVQDEEGLDATSGIGQPALSRGRVVFPTNNGAFTYGPRIAITAPAPAAPVQGTTPLSAHTLDGSATTITFKVDGVVVGSATPTAGSATVNWNSLSVPDGEHVVTAETSNDQSAQRPFTVDNFKPPTARLTVSPSVGNVDQDVTLNASGSTPTPGEQNDAIVRWAFEIDGDNDYDDIVEGAGGDGIVTTRFSTPGSKTVSVRVTDGHGDTATADATFRVNAPPAVNLTATPNPAAAGEQVTFDATGTSDPDGSITKYEFDLDGNGTFETDNGTNPKASKALAATTTVGVRVTDNEGGQTIKTVTVNVTPANQPPVASFIVAPNPAVTGQEVGFSAAASKDPDGKVEKYEWDFDGNGSVDASGALVVHKYSNPGVFKAVLRVTDNQGATGVTTVDVIVARARCVATNRCRPRFTASVNPKRDRRLPYVFTTKGRVRLPTGVRAADGCAGRVSVQVKRGKTTLSNRRTKLRRNCRFTSKVTFRNRDRLDNAQSLRFVVRFLGNKVLKPRKTTTKRVRIR